jgi:DNA polymerase III sliding clamp (beta) subunit (PCNA family)
MAQDKKIVEFHLEDGTPFLMEIEGRAGSQERVTRGGVDINVGRAAQSFEQALDRVVPVAAAAFNRLKQGLITPASEVEIKFGLKMTAEAGVVISSVGGEVNFEVTLTWKQE